MAWRGILSRVHYLYSNCNPITTLRSVKTATHIPKVIPPCLTKPLMADARGIAHRASGEADVNCWKCGADIRGQVLCQECSTIQKPDREANYFRIFSFPPSFHLDQRDLTTRFRKLQMQLHPDRFSRKALVEQEVSAEYSSLVNRAYKTLFDPVERGNYLLQLHGVPLQEGETHLESDFLMEIMELNEKLLEAEEEDVDRLDSENQEVVDKLINGMSHAFKDGRVEDARITLAKIKYYANIADKIKDLRHKLGKVH